MIKKAEHVAMIVTDMDRSIAFYQEMFGYQVRLRGQGPTREMTFLFHDNQPGFEIELIRDLTPMGDYSEQGLVNHLAFTVDHIDEAIAYYREKGIVFKTEKPNPSLDGGRTIFFHGPDRELLQFVEPGKDRK
ncbi:VOC family protein [Brevibacillus choshinensis]|uniref:VOC family protein n=1 Tax=Brevibacillus choshinensis TaxID=54911 RepID=UPI002E24654D|nr:VOC family protein [Brevibacillus choshinensis]MED4754683.1 VOC family protein [Brevibacillus choshinensis]MED4780422.1 VOC family protein [Brevibacillus choshinensis]